MRVFWAHILDRCYRPEALNLLRLNFAPATGYFSDKLGVFPNDKSVIKLGYLVVHSEANKGIQLMCD